MYFPNRTRIRLVILLALLILLLAGPARLATAAPADQGPPHNSYIVVFNQGVDPHSAAADLAREHGLSVAFVYSHALNGMAATVPEGRLIGLANDPRVDYVEADQVVTLEGTQSPATWGLDRIDQRSLPLDNSYTYNTTGAGDHVYIIDTGIRTTHTEFGGRASGGYTAINDGNGTNDCHGHGTHVAGTVGGSTYGVAKGVTLVAVRVLDCSGSGTWSGVIAGVDWVTANAIHPAAANMSLGGGVSYNIAAGNSNANACNYSPARVSSAITVGATDSSDARASFSNYGSCLDIFAPGVSITSSWNTSDTATNTISGTSMATPHTAGVAALYLEANPSASPAAVRDALVNGGTAGVVGNAGTGSPNVLLYSLLTGGSPP